MLIMAKYVGRGTRFGVYADWLPSPGLTRGNLSIAMSPNGAALPAGWAGLIILAVALTLLVVALPEIM